MRALFFAAALTAGAAAAGPALAAEFILSSTDVKAGTPMALKQAYTECQGANVSPALSWSNPPAGTQSFAITMFDADAPGGKGWWHWLVYDIPASAHDLPAGAGTEGSKDLPAGAVEGRNDFGLASYSGPCPPAGDHAHHYEITIYAIKVAQLPVAAGAPPKQVSDALKADALATADIVGRYERMR